tara:strand:+ start:69 stop:230 length:162 start_codon:yes stop_codon:yes gene_type:complete
LDKVIAKKRKKIIGVANISLKTFIDPSTLTFIGRREKINSPVMKKGENILQVQ